jgi:hypothetical protein
MGVSFWVKPVIFVPLNQFQDRNFQVTSTAAFWTPEIKGPLRWPGVCAQSQFPTATWIAGGQGHLGLQAETPEEFHMIVFTNGSYLDSLLFGQISSMLRLFPSLCLILSFSPHLHHVDNNMFSLRYPAPLFCDGYQGIYYILPLRQNCDRWEFHFCSLLGNLHTIAWRNI